MQISAEAVTGTAVLVPTADDNGPYDLPRRLVLALQGAQEAQTEAIQHLRDTGQVQPGDVIDTNWPAE
jgi:hypothetical protein